MSATLVLLLSRDLDRSADVPSARISWSRAPLCSLALFAFSSDRLCLFLRRGLLLCDDPLLLDLLLSHLNLLLHSKKRTHLLPGSYVLDHDNLNGRSTDRSCRLAARPMAMSHQSEYGPRRDIQTLPGAANAIQDNPSRGEADVDPPRSLPWARFPGGTGRGGYQHLRLL